MNDPITLILADDHSMVRLGLKAYFSTLTDIEVIGEASTGEQVVQLVEQQTPDVVLMDLLMPGIGGIEATRQVRRISPSTQVIILTSYHDDEHIFPAIRAGALSYVLKDIDPDDLADAVRRAHANEAILNPRIAARLVKEMSGSREEKANPFRELTGREFEVLREIAAGKNNQEIAEFLVISEKTVKTHITNILSKLHLADRTQAAVLAWQEGIVRRNNT
jgi:two-component system, NarL family, response regulator LiaR